MKFLIKAVSILVVGLFSANVCMAGDVEDVIRTTNEHFATQNNGDARGHVEGHMPYITFFLANGKPLNHEGSHEEQFNNMQALYDAGFKFNLRFEDPEVQIFGNGTVAVLTGYMLGTTIRPDGTAQDVKSRRTAVLVKDGGEWKEVHAHSSPYLTE